MFGFEKNDRVNVSDKELEALKMLASALLGLTDEQIEQALDDGTLLEVNHEKKIKAQFLPLCMKPYQTCIVSVLSTSAQWISIRLCASRQ